MSFYQSCSCETGNWKVEFVLFEEKIEAGCRKLSISAQERTKQVSNIMYLSVFTYTVDINFKGDSEVQVQF